MDHLEITLRNLLTIAWLLPLAGFFIELYALQLRWSHRLSKAPAYLAVFCILTGFVCSAVALGVWGTQTHWSALIGVHADQHKVGHPSEEGHAHQRADAPRHGKHRSPEIASLESESLTEIQSDAHAQAKLTSNEMHRKADHASHADLDHAHEVRGVIHPIAAGTYYRLAKFGGLEISLDYYIDSLTLVMFVMVTLIATCIHVFAIGYMSDELTEEYVDHEVHLRDGKHLHRPGRFHRFFAFLSLFCFSMLGLVLAGNIFQVFVFWELVGICSYLLIGFYVERRTANTAANKAFIMNRVGDFGFIIGLMIIWTTLGTFRFYDRLETSQGAPQPGLFTLIRGNDGQIELSDSSGPWGTEVVLRNAAGEAYTTPAGTRTISYLLLIAAGLGIFAGCIGKSAQFPLQTWLPDAMEGPTPVSALVHSATMVAAGVYLAARFYPMFLPEVLLVIAYVGCITLFVAATIALVVTDIKRVLAYSTISQLGYMMLGIGVAGWGAGLFHLVTHAYFKSLMFLASGSVIYGCHHVQDMRQMGGLRRRMPWTAAAMLVGVIAIAGLAVPVLTIAGEPIAFSGYHSKDAIMAAALAYAQANPVHGLLFVVPLITAGITAFYMFRLWFITFAGPPRNPEVYEHAHESPWVMVGPLMVLSALAIFVAVGGEEGALYRLIAASESIAREHAQSSQQVLHVILPGHHEQHEVHATAGGLALVAALLGTVLASVMYGRRMIDPADIRRHFRWCYDFLIDKWRFDALYEVIFLQPVHVIARWCQGFDRNVLDRLLNSAAEFIVGVSRWERQFDETLIDGMVNWVGHVTYTTGSVVRNWQTGKLRHYVMWIAVGVLVLYIALFTTLPR